MCAAAGDSMIQASREQAMVLEVKMRISWSCLAALVGTAEMCIRSTG